MVVAWGIHIDWIHGDIIFTGIDAGIIVIAQAVLIGIRPIVPNIVIVQCWRCLAPGNTRKAVSGDDIILDKGRSGDDMNAATVIHNGIVLRDHCCQRSAGALIPRYSDSCIGITVYQVVLDSIRTGAINADPVT